MHTEFANRVSVLVGGTGCGIEDDHFDLAASRLRNRVLIQYDSWSVVFLPIRAGVTRHTECQDRAERVSLYRFHRFISQLKLD
jgi:hypothetical protein